MCASCAEEQAKTPYCSHSDKQRALKHQVYCTPELFKALDKGYKLLEVDEVWHWKERSAELFREFQLKCMKAKIASSGFPSNCVSEEQKHAYVKEQNSWYHFNLHLSDVAKNAGRRTLAKQNLNQFWGRFGMVTNKVKTSIVSDFAEVLKLYNNPNLEIGEGVDITERKLLINYTHMDELAPIQGNLSLVVALFTTCWAICRDKNSATLYNREEVKKWSVVSDEMFLQPFPH